jgi:hypothetical protein
MAMGNLKMRGSNTPTFTLLCFRLVAGISLAQSFFKAAMANPSPMDIGFPTPPVANNFIPYAN